MKPTLIGYLELLVKVLVSTILLIFMGVGCAILVLAAPFLLSLVCVLALVGAGCFIFNWTYVYIGMIFLLILMGLAFE